MDKRDFIMQYVLNRASASSNGLDGAWATREGAKAWDQIEALAPVPSFPPKRIIEKKS